MIKKSLEALDFGHGGCISLNFFVSLNDWECPNQARVEWVVEIFSGVSLNGPT